MSIDIKLHKNDLPDEIKLDDKKSIAIDSEFSGLNVNRDKLYLVQISTGNNDAVAPYSGAILEIVALSGNDNKFKLSP